MWALKKERQTLAALSHTTKHRKLKLGDAAAALPLQSGRLKKQDSGGENKSLRQKHLSRQAVQEIGPFCKYFRLRIGES